MLHQPADDSNSGSSAGTASAGRSAIDRIATALDVVATRGWVSATELGDALGVDRSTGWRLARSLERVGWLRHDPVSGRYRLGIPLFELGTRVLDTIDFRDEARAVMTDLVASTGESVDLAVRDGDSVVFIDKLDGTNEVRAFTRSGQRARLHAAAAGKVFLAAMPEAELAGYLAGPLPAYTPATVTDAERVRTIVAETRERGWAINRGELFPEAGALAVPVYDARGITAAALGLNVPLSRLTDERIEALVAGLESGARRLALHAAA